MVIAVGGRDLEAQVDDGAGRVVWHAEKCSWLGASTHGLSYWAGVTAGILSCEAVSR